MSDKTPGLKIYIAGKITGDTNYRRKFFEATKRLESSGHHVMSPAVLPLGFDYEDYMKICIAMLSVCDVVYFLRDWRTSPGAIREMSEAMKLGKIIIFEENGIVLS